MKRPLTTLCATLLLAAASAHSQPLVNLGLVGVGRLPSESFDQLGPMVDTLGGTFSGMALDLSTLTNSGNTYAATLHGLPDRGFGDGLRDYHNRVQTYRFAITPYYGPFPAPAPDQISLANIGTTLLTWGDNFLFTGANPDDTNVTSRPQSSESSVGRGKWSMDSEGVALARDGSFYVSDEYGPFVYHFNSGGQLLGTLVPPPAYLPKVGTNFPRAINYGATLVATNDSGRFENRGFEGLALTPDGRRLVAMLQTAVAQDGSSKAGARNARILVFDVDPASSDFNQPVAEHLFQLTLNGNEARNRSTPISELLALNGHQFLVIERDSRGRGGDAGPILYKRVVLIDLAGASNLIRSGYDLEKGDTGQMSLPRTTLPANIAPVSRTDLVDFADAAQLARFGLNVKTNWDANTLSEKWEGLAVLPLNDPAAPNDYLLLIGNDNDFKAATVYHNGVIVGTNEVAVDTMMLAFRIGEDHTAPVLNCPANVTVLAGPNCSLPDITAFATATDNSAAPVSFSQNPPAGTPLGLGSFPVSVVATDAAGNASSSCTVTVTIADPPPNLVCPTRITVATDTNCQAVVPDLLSGTNVVASDNCGSPVTLTQTPPGGAVVGAGTNTLTVIATDGTGLSTTCRVAFVVVGGAPVILDCPDPILIEIGGTCTAMIPDLRDRVVVRGACGSPVTVTQSPTNGTIVGPGVYHVVLTATDAAGNRSFCTNTVTVVDLTPPNIDCPGNIAVDALSAAGTVVSYPVPAASGFCETNLAVVCAPRSGGTFPIGATVVTCTAASASGNRASCSFTITVRGPRAIKRDVLAALNGWSARVTDREERRRLDDAIDRLTDSLALKNWVDDNHLSSHDGKTAFKKEEDTVKKFGELIKSAQKHPERTLIPIAVWQGYIDRIVLADRLLAQVAINEALARHCVRGNLADALKKLADGDKKAADDDYDAAIKDYRRAWEEAMEALDE